jgi:hypothetical protein
MAKGRMRSPRSMARPPPPGAPMMDKAMPMSFAMNEEALFMDDDDGKPPSRLFKIFFR